MRFRAALCGFALALTAGWNLSNVGAVADRISSSYGVGLAVVGLFTTALLVTHAAMQVPAGRLCDRMGARLVGGTGLVIAGLASAGALTWHQAWFAIALRCVAGVGTACAFVGGSDYVRATIGTPGAQGMYGAMSVASGGLALALVPLWGSWRAPFATSGAAAGLGLALVALGPREGARAPLSPELPSVVDRRLFPLTAMHAASFGLSVVLANWIVTYLHRAGGNSHHVAGLVGALVLLLGIVTRPLGARVVDRPAALRLSFLVGGAAIAVLVAAKPLPLMIVAAAVIGLTAGLPFASTFARAARVRPDAPAAAVGFVNMGAAATILVGTPLLGLGFSLPGNGRIGFAVVAVLFATAAAAARKPSTRVPTVCEAVTTGARHV